MVKYPWGNWTANTKTGPFVFLRLIFEPWLISNVGESLRQPFPWANLAKRFICLTLTSRWSRCQIRFAMRQPWYPGEHQNCWMHAQHQYSANSVVLQSCGYGESYGCSFQMVSFGSGSTLTAYKFLNLPFSTNISHRCLRKPLFILPAHGGRF